MVEARGKQGRRKGANQAENFGTAIDDAALAAALDDIGNGRQPRQALFFMEGGRALTVAGIARADIPAHFGFVAQPRPAGRNDTERR